MKKVTLLLLTCIFCISNLIAQNTFPAAGRVGIHITTPAASLQIKGGARIGTLTNYTNIDSATGNLSFTGTAGYRVANNQFAFLSASSPLAGLFFNAANLRYEFRNTAGASVLNIGANNTGNVGIGTLTPVKMLDVNGDALINGITTGTGSGNVFTNTATGNQALYTNTTGFQNTANGYQTLFSNTTGNYNTAGGYQGLYSNTTGYENTANGFKALYANTTGYDNTAFGAFSLRFNTIGHANTAIGYLSLYNNSTGIYNSAIGSEALSSNTTGGNNTATGYYSLLQNTSGSFNTGIGYFTLYNNTTGSNNTAIGYGSGTSSNNFSNATALGSFAGADASNKVRIGNTSVTSIGGQVGWSNFSDGRIKKNVKENVPGLAFINLLRPVTYNYNMAKEYELLGRKDTLQWEGKDDIEKINFTGFVAQEVDAAAQKANYDFSGIDKTGKIMALRYSEFVVPLVKAVQELSKQNDALKEEVTSQQKINNDLQQQINDLRAMIITGNTTAPTTEFSQSQLVIPAGAADLEQNAPNPFSAVTTMRYILPQKFTRAYIVITDNTGKTVKQVTLSGAGKGMLNVEAGSLAAGTYKYSLIVDGKLINSKTMILTK